MHDCRSEGQGTGNKRPPLPSATSVSRPLSHSLAFLKPAGDTFVDASTSPRTVHTSPHHDHTTTRTTPHHELTVLRSSSLQSSTGTAPRIALGSRALSPVGPNLALWMHASAEETGEAENGAAPNVRELIDHSPTVVKSDITLKFTHVHRNLVRVSAWSFRASGSK